MRIDISKGKADLYMYTLYDEYTQNEIACFPDLLRAALVCRYISGMPMNEKDSDRALAAISEFDEEMEAGKMHRQGGQHWGLEN